VKDALKCFAIELALGTVVVCGIVWIILNAGELFYLYIWVFISVVLLVLFLTFHVIVAPWFKTFPELEESTLKSKIFALAASLSFPLKKIFVIDGFKRSSHSNAYFFGFLNNKRIVVFDTLLDKTKYISEDEVTAIVAHELGHWQHSHSLKGLVLTEVQIFAIFYVFSHVIHNSDIYHSFGFAQASPLVGPCAVLVHLCPCQLRTYSALHEAVSVP
jgi:STE24 endopeptidase